MSFKLRSKIWFENNGKVFGDGPFELLQRVDEMGSLRKAAADMKMSYRQAWDLIKMVEKNLHFPLLEKQAGGKQGGGSCLTKKGKNLMLRYKDFRQEANISLEKIYNKHFHDIDY